MNAEKLYYWAVRLTMIIFCLGRTTLLAHAEPGTADARVLHFPKDRSLGTVTVKKKDNIPIWVYHQWFTGEYLGPAQGDVVIPAGKKAGLFLNEDAVKDLSPLLDLKPDDLSFLSGGPTVRYQDLPEKCMQQITHLTGLRILFLTGMRTTTESMKHITKLQSLETLMIPKELTDEGLSYIAQLGSLSELYFNENTNVTNKGLGLYLPRLTKLERLSLSGDQITDEGLIHLSKLPRLRYLSLNSGNFTNAGLVHVRQCTSLLILDLNHLPITGAGLQHLSGHAQLEELSLFNTGVTDRGLEYLTSIPSLKKLNLGKMVRGRGGIQDEQITDAGMTHIARIHSLECLRLPSSGITDKGLAAISCLKNLKDLSVCTSTSSPLTDTALKHVSALQSLESLHIGGRGFTNSGMDDLAKLANLKKLSLIANYSITDKGLAKLKALQRLKELKLSCFEGITISGLSSLNAFKNLSKLQMDFGIVQDDSGLDLSGLTNLEDLRLRIDSPIYDKDLACLKALKKLETLVIGGGIKGALVTDAGIAYLKELDLQEFYCRSPYLTDESLSHLATIKTLRFLNVSGNFTDDGLGYLEKLKTLGELEVSTENRFSTKAMAQLKKQLISPNIVRFKENIKLQRPSGP